MSQYRIWFNNLSENEQDIILENMYNIVSSFQKPLQVQHQIDIDPKKLKLRKINTNMAARKIQRWYRSQIPINDETTDDIKNWDSRSFFIRYVFKTYDQNALDTYVYPRNKEHRGVIGKIKYFKNKDLEPYTGNKNSDLRKWMFKELTIDDLACIGI